MLPHPHRPAKARALAPALAALLLLAAAPARAHQATHQVVRGQAIAVRALEDGEGMAAARWQVFSPADPARPWQEGRTDRQGWLAFVPDAPGTWRLRVIEEDGHGLDVGIDAGSASPAALASSPAGGPAWLRALAGLAALAAIFGAIHLVQRRRAGDPRG